MTVRESGLRADPWQQENASISSVTFPSCGALAPQVVMMSWTLIMPTAMMRCWEPACGPPQTPTPAGALQAGRRLLERQAEAGSPWGTGEDERAAVHSKRNPNHLHTKGDWRVVGFLTSEQKLPRPVVPEECTLGLCLLLKEQLVYLLGWDWGWPGPAASQARAGGAEHIYIQLQGCSS